MNREQIVEKVQKLLRLSKSDNEHEASLAMANANKLLLKYNLEMSDVDEIDINEILEETVMSGKRMISWKLLLLNAIMDLNNCTIITHNRIRGEKSVKAIGKKQNIAISMSMFDYVCKTMDRKLKHFSGDAFAFRMGFTSAIQQKVREIIQSRKTDVQMSDCTALVVQEKALVKQFIDEKYNNLKSKSLNTKGVDRQGYMAGMNEGRNVSFNGQVSC